MKIILMRHGKPVLANTGWVTPVEMEQWIEHYNFAEVEADGVPPTSLILASSAACVVASTSRRALSTVHALGHTVCIADTVFCEAQLPFTLWRFPRLPPFVWAAFFRLLWFLGYSRDSESVEVAKARAKAATHQLIALADTGGQSPVLLVGHGIMNRLIAKELIALGWSGISQQESKYWRASVYEFQTNFASKKA